LKIDRSDAQALPVIVARARAFVTSDQFDISPKP
jgi:hypothetical protein